MKQEYKTYGLMIGIIGEKIDAISKRIGTINQIEGNTTEILMQRRDSYNTCLDEYRVCKSQLLKMSVPDVIKQEHLEFVGAFDLFIEGTSKAFNAIDIENVTTDEELIKEGLSEQKKGEPLAVFIADKITKKLLQS